MPPQLALFLGVVLAMVALRADKKHGGDTTWALFWPTLWYLVVASRPVGVWFAIWGIPLPGSSGDPTEGSVTEQFFYGGLTIIGFAILVHRRFEWRRALQDNPWLAALLVWAALSIAWSNYPYVSFKRFIKVLGSLSMALVVLTSINPLAAIRTVLRRALYVHLPMSIICIKYFRNIGISWDWSGTAEAWQGISTSKNTLGQIAMLGTLYFLWELWRAGRSWKRCKLELLYLAISIFLLKGAEDSVSLTSISVCVFGISIFYVLQYFRYSVQSAERFLRIAIGLTASFVLLIITHSVLQFSSDSFFGEIITLFGRDITLTDRTFIWNDVYAIASESPIVGVGFGGFWIGRIANIPWNANMTWVLGQAHNGYIDTYLQLGWIGAATLSALLIVSLIRNTTLLRENFDLATLRITLLLTTIFVNVTESTFLRGDHHLWFLLQLAIWFVPAGKRTASANVETRVAADRELQPVE